MVAITHLSTKLGALGLGAFTVGVAALTFGAGIASANPNDPSLDRVGGNGVVSSRQAASTSTAKHCEVGLGTLGTASTPGRSDIGVPTQRANESGPGWVGSNGWQAIGLTGANPWAGNFLDTARTGPQCRTGQAHKAGIGNAW